MSTRSEITCNFCGATLMALIGGAIVSVYILVAVAVVKWAWRSL